MPKLYYTTTSCVTVSFVMAKMCNVKLETEQVDLSTHKVIKTGEDFYAINPKGNVPCLVLDDRTQLIENIAVHTWICDQNPSTGLGPTGKTELYQYLNATSYVGTEIHPAIGILFYPGLSDDVKEFTKTRFIQKMTDLNDRVLKGKNYMNFNRFTASDAYLYICLSWCGYVGLDYSAYPKVVAFYERVKNLPGVVAAHTAMASNPSHTK
eukprot:gene34819-45039_t